MILITVMAPKRNVSTNKLKNKDPAKYLLGINIWQNNFISYCLHVPNSITIKGMSPEKKNGSVLHTERRKR